MAFCTRAHSSSLVRHNVVGYAHARTLYYSIFLIGQPDDLYLQICSHFFTSPTHTQHTHAHAARYGHIFISPVPRSLRVACIEPKALPQRSGQYTHKKKPQSSATSACLFSVNQCARESITRMRERAYPRTFLIWWIGGRSRAHTLWRRVIDMR